MKQLAVYSIRVTVRAEDEAGVTVPILYDAEVIVEQAFRNVLLKQRGGVDNQLVEVNADAERVDQ